MAGDEAYRQDEQVEDEKLRSGLDVVEVSSFDIQVYHEGTAHDKQSEP